MVKLTFIGDVMLKREQLAAIKDNRHTFLDTFSRVKGLLADSDYVVGNLETPLAGESAGYVSKPAWFNAPDDFAIALKEAGVDFLTTSNNHCLDRGVAGLKRTLDVLDDIGISHTGTYRSAEESKIPTVIDVKGLRAGLFAPTYGTNSEHGRPMLAEDELWAVDMLRRQLPPRVTGGGSLLSNLKQKLIATLPGRVRDSLLVLKNGLPKASPRDFTTDNVDANAIDNPQDRQSLDVALSKLARLRSVADFIVALPHVGGQYNPYPGRYARHVVGAFAEAGADAVIANHSHCPLNFDLVKGKVPVVYSLGNFAATPYVDWYVYGSLSDYSIVFNLYVDETTKKVEKKSYSMVKNVMEKDGFTYTVLANEHLSSLKDNAAKDRVEVEMQAVSQRFCGKHIDDFGITEYFI